VLALTQAHRQQQASEMTQYDRTPASRRVAVTGWLVLSFLGYCMAAAVVYFFSLLALEHDTLLEIPWFAGTQRQLYLAGIGARRENWLRPGCIAPDPELIYKPVPGTCTLDAIEFSVTIDMTTAGRYTGDKPAGTGIAVIGDSHAMGWGVEDLETFSARLQAMTGRPVYNLGVASYGTARELLRLERADVLDRIDTVILQYCNNDYGENIAFDGYSPEQRRARGDRLFGQFSQETKTHTAGIAMLAKGYLLALKAPFSELAAHLRRKDFTRHYEALAAVIDRHHDILRGKRVIVFYSNPYGQRYRNFPHGGDPGLYGLYFADVGLDRADHYRLDGHPTPAAHRKIAGRLFEVL
jgi:hypothetical protein